MMWGYPDGFGWWMLFGGMWMIVFWGVIIGLIVWGISRITGVRNNSKGENNSPIEIAKRRLAIGEITREQFEELREILEVHS